MLDENQFGRMHSAQSVSTIHHTMRSSRRRLTVLFITQKVLNQNENVFCSSSPSNGSTSNITVREIARYIVSVEQGVSEKHATGEPYHNVYTSLIQSHLPRLDAVQAVRYDDDRKTVQPSRNLIALATVATATAPLTQILFTPDMADLFAGGSERDEIGN